jgi:hypothetical protein
METHYIVECQSKYPNGYNLTNGGQGPGYMKGDKIVHHEPNPPIPISERKSLKRCDYTKQLISERLKACKQDPVFREVQMKMTQNQHYNKKFDLYNGVAVDVTNLEQYISVIRNIKQNTEYVRVTIQGIRSHFVGKHEPLSEIKTRAINFIKELAQRQHNQIAGTPLELLTTTHHNGNIGEELG